MVHCAYNVIFKILHFKIPGHKFYICLKITKQPSSSSWTAKLNTTMPEFDLLAFEAGYLDAFTFSKVMEVNNKVNSSPCHALGSKGRKILHHDTQCSSRKMGLQYQPCNLHKAIWHLILKWFIPVVPNLNKTKCFYQPLRKTQKYWRTLSK